MRVNGANTDMITSIVDERVSSKSVAVQWYKNS